MFNAGNRMIDEYGDTSDRLQWTSKVGDVFLMGGFENRSEGLPAVADDFRSVLASVVYQTEKFGIGTLHTYRWQSNDDDGTAIGIWKLEDQVIITDFGVNLRGAAFYEDRYVKTERGWKITHTGYSRTFEEMHPATSIEGLHLKMGEFS